VYGIDFVVCIAWFGAEHEGLGCDDYVDGEKGTTEITLVGGESVRAGKGLQHYYCDVEGGFGLLAEAYVAFLE
jgi:hypothetical protein